MVARRVGAVLLAIMLGGGLAACGDDGGDDGAVDQVDRDDNGGDGGGDGGSSDDGCDDGGDDGTDDTVDLPDGIFGSEECTEIIEAFSAFGSVFTGGGDFDFQEMADGFDAIGDRAPEIADDLAVMAEVYREFGEAVGDDANFTDPAVFQDPAVIAASEAFSSDEFNEAADNVSAFMDEACSLSG